METLLNTLMNHSGPTPYFIVFFILVACGFGLPMPEDIVLFAAGMMSFYGSTDVRIMIAVCFVGVMLGDSAVFTIGALYGRKLRRRPFMRRLLPPKRLKIVRHKLHEQGNKVIFAARFMPGFRTPIFFSAGTLHLPFRVFLLFDGLAALVSVPTIVFVTYHFGNHVDKVVRVVKRVQFGVIGTILLIVAVVVIKSWYAHKKELDMVEKEVP